MSEIKESRTTTIQVGSILYLHSSEGRAIHEKHDLLIERYSSVCDFKRTWSLSLSNLRCECTWTYSSGSIFAKVHVGPSCWSGKDVWCGNFEGLQKGKAFKKKDQPATNAKSGQYQLWWVQSYSFRPVKFNKGKYWDWEQMNSPMVWVEMPEAQLSLNIFFSSC